MPLPRISNAQCKEVPLRSPSLMGMVSGLDYLFYLRDPNNLLKAKVDAILASDDIPVERRKKKSVVAKGTHTSTSLMPRSYIQSSAWCSQWLGQTRGLGFASRFNRKNQ